jgi:tetratricopeptide (TPR) repeat protein
MDNYITQFERLRARALLEAENGALFQQLLISMELHRNYRAHIALYREILDARPYAALAWYNLGIAYRQSDCIDEALDALEYAFICDTSLEAAYYAFAEFALQDGQARRALQCLEEMQRHLSPEEAVLVRLSECALHAGDLQKASRYAQQALRLNPFCADACFWLGKSAAAADNPRSALRWFRESVRLDDSREDLHRALAELYFQQDKPDDARTHFLRAAELAPDEPANWTGAAVAHLVAGRPELALQLLEEADAFTDSFEIAYCRAACLFLLARRAEAWPVFHRALRENFGFHQVIFNWAPSLADDREVQTAIANFC